MPSSCAGKSSTDCNDTCQWISCRKRKSYCRKGSAKHVRRANAASIIAAYSKGKQVRHVVYHPSLAKERKKRSGCRRYKSRTPCERVQHARTGAGCHWVNSRCEYQPGLD
jgi:hypothetical protein